MYNFYFRYNAKFNNIKINILKMKYSFKGALSSELNGFSQ